MAQEFYGVASRIFTENFECFKSNMCHLLHDHGDIEFLLLVLNDNLIKQLEEHQCMGYALYALAMFDHISKENNLELCSDYDDLRSLRLKELAVPASIRLCQKILPETDYKNLLQKAYANAIPEFLKYNILEGDIRNVC